MQDTNLTQLKCISSQNNCLFDLQLLYLFCCTVLFRHMVKKLSSDFLFLKLSLHVPFPFISQCRMEICKLHLTLFCPPKSIINSFLHIQLTWLPWSTLLHGQEISKCNFLFSFFFNILDLQLLNINNDLET